MAANHQVNRAIDYDHMSHTYSQSFNHICLVASLPSHMIIICRTWLYEGI
jgi:hypothetical protein